MGRGGYTLCKENRGIAPACSGDNNMILMGRIGQDLRNPLNQGNRDIAAAYIAAIIYDP
jgi:hypothetical protein